MSCVIRNMPAPAPAPIGVVPPIAFTMDGVEVFAFPAVGFKCINISHLKEGVLNRFPHSVRAFQYIPIDTLFKIRDRLRSHN